ncbi:MAG: response regulator [Alphaproteobacteria bacterium]
MTTDSYSGRVLLVDDMELNQMVGAGLMRQLGVEVDIASSGIEALGMIDANAYDLVFMDIHMPDMDGLEVTRRIRARESEGGGGHLTVVALTAISKDEDKQDCSDAGMDDHIGKPLIRERLKEILERYLGPGGNVDTVSPGASGGAIAVGIDKARFDDLCETMGGIAGGVADVLADYMESVTRLAADIADGLQGGDMDKMVRAAHSLKSNSLTVGALAISDLSLQIESTGREGQTEGCAELLQRIRDEFDSIRPGLQEMINLRKTDS